VTWDTFFAAEVGASAALAGLIFVGVSINLRQIVGLPMLANRALQALGLLVGSLGIESLLMVPGQSTLDQGVETTAVAGLLWFTVNVLERRSWANVPVDHRAHLRAHSVEIQFPCAFAFVGGVLLAASNPSALYWFVPASLGSFLVAIVEAWVITVEIVR